MTAENFSVPVFLHQRYVEETEKSWADLEWGGGGHLYEYVHNETMWNININRIIEQHSIKT